MSQLEVTKDAIQAHLRTWSTKQKGGINGDLNKILREYANTATEIFNGDTKDDIIFRRTYRNPLQVMEKLASENADFAGLYNNSLQKYFAKAEVSETFNRTFTTSLGEAKPCNISDTVMRSKSCVNRLWNTLLTPIEVDFCVGGTYQKNFSLKNSSRATVTPCGVVAPLASLNLGKVTVSPVRLALQYNLICSDILSCATSIDKFLEITLQWIENLNDTFDDIVKAQLLLQPALAVPNVAGEYIQNLETIKKAILSGGTDFDGNIKFVVSRRMYDAILTQKDDNGNYIYKSQETNCGSFCQSICVGGMEIFESTFAGLRVSATQDYIFAGVKEAGEFMHSPMTDLEPDETQRVLLGLQSYIGTVHADAVIPSYFAGNFGYAIVNI